MEQQQPRDAIYGQITYAHDRQRNPIVIKRMNRQAMAQQRVLRTGQPVLEDGFKELQLCEFLQSMPHPHLVTILNTTVTPTEVCIEMPYYSNGELYSHIASEDHPLPPAQLLRIFQDIVSGMNHLHQHHIAHLDLSLENVLLDAEMRASVCDFGLAERNALECSNGRGKALYMAPEMYTETTFNGYQCDMWSLGVILFTMFTGSPPVQMAHEEDVCFRKLKDRGVAYLIKTWKFQLPPMIIQLLERLLVVNPKERMTREELMAHPLIKAPSGRALHWLAPNVACYGCLKRIGRGHRKYECERGVYCSACFS